MATSYGNETFRVIDPRGDTLIIGRYFTEDFAPQAYPPTAPTDAGSRQVFKYLVSSKRLRLTSKVFRKEIDTSDIDGNEEFVITVSQHWNANAFAIFMLLIHDRGSEAPDHISLPMIVMLNVMVDHYKCRGAIQRFSSTWGTLLVRAGMPGPDDIRGSMLWLCRVWHMEDDVGFRLLTKNILLSAKRDRIIDTRGMGLPRGLIDALNFAKNQIIDDLGSDLHQIVTDLRQNDYQCPSDPELSLLCASSIIGGVAQILSEHKVLNTDWRGETGNVSLLDILDRYKRIIGMKLMFEMEAEDDEVKTRIHECSFDEYVDTAMVRTERRSGEGLEITDYPKGYFEYAKTPQDGPSWHHVGIPDRTRSSVQR